jgi:putative membrane protein
MVAVVALSMTTSVGYYGMMGSGGWPWAMVFMAVPGIILILVLIFALGVLNPNRSYTPYPTHAPQPTSAVEILDQRYARGELSREDYLRMRSEVSPR